MYRALGSNPSTAGIGHSGEHPESQHLESGDRRIRKFKGILSNLVSRS